MIVVAVSECRATSVVSPVNDTRGVVDIGSVSNNACAFMLIARTFAEALDGLCYRKETIKWTEVIDGGM